MNISMKSTKKFQTGPVNYIFVLCAGLKMRGADHRRDFLIVEAKAVGMKEYQPKLRSVGQTVFE